MYKKFDEKKIKKQKSNVLEPVVFQYIDTDRTHKDMRYGKFYRYAGMYKKKNGNLNIHVINDLGRKVAIDEQYFRAYTCKEDLNIEK